jgi:hypothetical protein
MLKRVLVSFITVATAAVVMAGLAVAGGASRGGSLPTLTVALTGSKGIAVSGSMVSGAVNVVSTFSGKVPKGPDTAPALALLRLHSGASFQQAFHAVESNKGDENALTPYGAVVVATNAPGRVQTVLVPGNYVALNVTANGAPGFAPFTVTASASPAALPAANATETAIEFAFRGPAVLHNNTVVRAVNQGWLVHMIVLIGVRDAATGHQIMTLLRAGKDKPAQKLASGPFVSLLDPASPGARQQQMLHAKPGYYIEACFMDTSDQREHTQVGMMRLVRVTA